MADATVTIAADGTTTPSLGSVQIDPGDSLTLIADGADVVICIAPPNFFGGPRFEIPDGDSITLTATPSASGAFEYVIKTGDLDAKCKGGRGTEDKSGTSGGT